MTISSITLTAYVVKSILDQIHTLEAGIESLYQGSGEDEGLYALMRKAVLLAIDRANLSAVYQASMDGQQAIENRFAQAMGDMLIDRYWSNANYSVG